MVEDRLIPIFVMPGMDVTTTSFLLSREIDIYVDVEIKWNTLHHKKKKQKNMPRHRQPTVHAKETDMR